MRFMSVLAAAACPWLVACSSSSFITEVKGETTVPASPPGVETPLNAFPAISSFAALDFDQNQDFKNQGVSKSDVKGVQVRSVTLKMLGPNDQDLRFLDALEFFARAGDKQSRMAHREGIAEVQLSLPNPELPLRAEDVDLRDFVAAPTMGIIVRGSGRLPEKEVRLQATVVLDVAVSLL
ncbi:hypothetical protein JGU66_10355 [Myxococcaceae bacterium JPH2]|nr:hypothetical protein [Myxococcaceae bacterium JPH2]